MNKGAKPMIKHFVTRARALVLAAVLAVSLAAPAGAEGGAAAPTGFSVALVPEWEMTAGETQGLSASVTPEPAGAVVNPTDVRWEWRCDPAGILTLNGGEDGTVTIQALAFGIVSTLRAFGIPLPASVRVSNLIAESPLLVVVMSMFPRLMVPLVTYGVHRLMAGRGARRYVALPVAAVAGTLTNTILYLGLMLLFYALTALDVAAVLGLIAGTGAIGGGAESVVAALVTTPVVLALEKIQKK